MRYFSFLVVASLLPSFGYSQVAKDSAGSPSLLIMQTLFGLLLVIGCIFLLAWAAKKLNLTQIGGNKNFSIVASIALSAREKAVLIQAGDQQILLGVAPGNVRQLQIFDEPIVVSQPNQDNVKTSLSASTATEFSKKLNEFLSQGNKT